MPAGRDDSRRSLRRCRRSRLRNFVGTAGRDVHRYALHDNPACAARVPAARRVAGRPFPFYCADTSRAMLRVGFIAHAVRLRRMLRAVGCMLCSARRMLCVCPAAPLPCCRLRACMHAALDAAAVCILRCVSHWRHCSVCIDATRTAVAQDMLTVLCAGRRDGLDSPTNGRSRRSADVHAGDLGLA